MSYSMQGVEYPDGFHGCGFSPFCQPDCTTHDTPQQRYTCTALQLHKKSRSGFWALKAMIQRRQEDEPMCMLYHMLLPMMIDVGISPNLKLLVG